MDTPLTAAAPISLNTSLGGVTPRFKGLKFTGQNAFQTQFANPSSLPQPIPQNGSDALNGTGQGLQAYDDVLMTQRGHPETLGAFEVDATTPVTNFVLIDPDGTELVDPDGTELQGI